MVHTHRFSRKWAFTATASVVHACKPGDQNIDEPIGARNPIGRIVGFGEAEHGIEKIERANVFVHVAVFDSARYQVIRSHMDLR